MANNNTSLYLFVQDIKTVGAPRLFEDYVVFTYQAREVTYYVGARFEHENYSILHKYNKNSNGLFVLVLPRPEDAARLRYRIVVDGLWMEDPANPLSEEDELGVRHSLVPLPPDRHKFIVSPDFQKDGTVKFNLRAPAGAYVFIAGDFNNWDPFMNKLTEENGIYSISLKLYPGSHYYYFLVNGKRVIDPHNENVRTDMDGLPVSVLAVPY